jgi:hypothetical protein
MGMSEGSELSDNQNSFLLMILVVLSENWLLEAPATALTPELQKKIYTTAEISRRSG